jgi:virginiamycin A acetyltransferase
VADAPVKNWIKSIVRGVSLLAMAPCVAVYWLETLVLGRDRALEDLSQYISLFPGIAGSYLRTAFLRCTLAECHPTAVVGFGSLFSKSGTRLEENVYIGPGCCIGLAHIGRDVLIASGVHIPSGGRIHGTSPDRPIREQPGTVSMVRIGPGAWIGATAVVMSDVGANAIVGAGAVVTRPIPSNVVAAGVPARVIRSRLEEEERPAIEMPCFRPSLASVSEDYARDH